MKECRKITKYPNRRLYDTVSSAYITLQELKQLILDERFQVEVIDSRTKADITYNTLLQIMVDQETQGTPLLSTKILEQMIRLHGGCIAFPEKFKKMLMEMMELFDICFKKRVEHYDRLGLPVFSDEDQGGIDPSIWAEFELSWQNHYKQLISLCEVSQSVVSEVLEVETGDV